MTWAELEAHLDQVEHALADLPPQARQPVDDFIHALMEAMFDMSKQVCASREQAAERRKQPAAERSLFPRFWERSLS